VLSLIAAVMTVVGVAELVRGVASPRAGVIGGLLAAVLTTAPALDGFAANGELLGGAFGALGLGVAARVLSGRSGPHWMLLAGALAGGAVSIKQSAADGLSALVVWLAVVAAFGLLPRREALWHLLRCAIGAGTVFASLMLHGALTGWDRWCYAVLGYRLSQRSALKNANWKQLRVTFHDVAPVLVPAILASIVAAILLLVWRRQRTVSLDATQMLVPIWAVISVPMFLSGGQFFHHYWLTLTYPLAAVGGLVIGTLALSWWRRALVLVAVGPALVSWVSFASVPREEIWPEISNERLPLVAEELGHWLTDEMQPSDTLFAMCAMPSLYAVAERDPVYRYMWFASVHNAKGAQNLMVELFTGPNPPTWVPLIFSTEACNPSGDVTRAMKERYHVVATVSGISVYHLDEGAG
jgi:hypothetical protein